MNDPVPITDPDDPRIEAYRAVRERDLVGRQGRFVIEGEVVLRTAIDRSRHPIESVLIAASRATGLADVLARLPPGVPVYSAEQRVLDVIAGFALHRGILAIGKRNASNDPAEIVATLPDEATVLVLAGIANHDNVGGLFRNAAAFGVDAVLLDATSCDPLYRKAIRVSAGAALLVPFVRGGTLAEIADILSQGGFDLLATSPAGREMLPAIGSMSRVAVVMGPEGPGLPSDFLAMARSVRIPMAPGFDSLNVATAAGIILHHLAATRPPRLKTSSTLPTDRKR